MFSSALKSFSSNILSNYQISPDPSLITGPWKIYEGKKKSTGTTASVFVFERKSLEPRGGGLGPRTSSTSTKKLHEEVVDRLKREASHLARLRHPSILQVLEPVEDTRNGGLMFATEPVTASLAGLLREQDGPGGAAGSSRYMVEEADGTRRRREVEIDELEIQKGLLQVAKGLEFLHESAGLIHGNLNPEAIYINAKSDWKISGLAFAGPPDDSKVQSSLPPWNLSEMLYQDARLPQSVQLNLDFTSPDFAIDFNATTAADMFSLGLLIVSIYNFPHVSPIQAHSNVSTYKKLLSSSSTTPSQANDFLSKRPIPKDLLSHVLPRLITRRPAQRLTAREFQQSQYFDNVLVSTIRFLESLPAKTPNEKSQFLRGLQRVLSDFPPSVLERKVLGALLEETKDRELLSLILQNVFKILKKVPNGRRVFPEKIIPKLKEIFLSPITNKGAAQERDTTRDAGLMVVLENIDTVAKNCSGKEFKEDILPIIRLGMESPTHGLVDAAMKCLPEMLPVLDFSTVKNEVFPPIAATFSRTNSLAIKIRGLECFVVLCGGSSDELNQPDDDLSGIIEQKPAKPSSSSILDKYTVQEKIVPLLKAIKTKEPAVMVAALNVFRQVGKIADSEFIALDVLPILWAFSLGPLLSLSQFQSFMSLIKSLSTKIEREHTKKLQEISARDESGGSRSNTGTTNANLQTSADVDGAKNDFERLVLGKNGTSNRQTDDLWDSWDTGTAKPQPSQQPTSPTFSWSSNPGQQTRSPSVSGMSSAFPPHSGRSITPDYSANTFSSFGAAPKQSTQMSQVFPALQPSSPSWSQSGATSSPLGMPSGAPGMTTLQSSQQSKAPNYSSFSLPPPPSGGSTNIQASFNQQSSNVWGTTPQNTNFQNSGTAGQQPQSKKGLDKYESLL